MDHNCVADTGQGCKALEVLKLQIAKLEKEVERDRGVQSEFRKTYYADREERIRRDVGIDAKIKAMDEKLDKVLAWQETQAAKPAKRLDEIVDKVLWAILAAVIAFFLGRLGL